MNEPRRQSGFSLTEVIFAIATLAIGMLFVGGTFMLGVHFSRVSTEQSIAPVVAEEAFAKLALYGFDEVPVNDSSSVLLSLKDENDWEYRYPSTNDNTLKQYHWTAIGRHLSGSDLMKVTIFVMRQDAFEQIIPEKSMAWAADPNIMDGMTVVTDYTGDLLRALVERGTTDVILDPVLAKEPNDVWFIGPSNGRNPCIGVFQRKMQF